MRFLPKGGIWKNTEDEILKASVMKYGLNQWSRISSLLTRKSAKQCKARWYEWLDPSIKKTEWTKEEEEKLLHLAKIMPTQWRTIAPMIGRTAVQCLEHYERLISMQDADNADAPDPKRIRPGEIDPAPETKPARPDPVDMDEDELEMLQEARARLANTKGKKAKRKARERMLKEARRMAAIQKRNELKAAGISAPDRKSRKDNSIDYNAEIPFHIRQPIGFYNTFEEDRYSAENKELLDFRTLTSETFEGNPEKTEALERRKDIKKQKLYKEAFLSDVIKQINNLNDPQRYVSKRPDLELPMPQVSNVELESIAKLYPTAVEKTLRGSSQLLASQRTPQTPYPSRTPLTADSRKKDIEDNIALSTAGNPLLGGESVVLHDPHFERRGINLENVKTSLAFTPNALVSSVLSRTGVTPGSTPLNHAANSQTPMGGTPYSLGTGFSAITPGATPLRDKLNINTPAGAYSNGFLDAGKGATPSSGLLGSLVNLKAQKKKRKRLRKNFGKLPMPRVRGSMHIVMPEIEDAPEERQAVEDDMDDVKRRIEESECEKKQSMESRMSTAHKRKLPKPSKFNGEVKSWSEDLLLKTKGELSREDILSAAEMIAKEYFEILKIDITKNDKTVFSEEDMEKLPEIKKMISAELQCVRESLTEEEKETLKGCIEGKRDFGEIDADIVFMPQSRRFNYLSDESREDQIVALRQEFELLRGRWEYQKSSCQKAESKIEVLLAGLQRRASKALEDLSDVDKEAEAKQRELFSFRKIYTRENSAIPLRRQSLKKNVESEMKREKELQKRYEKLFGLYRGMINDKN